VDVPFADELLYRYVARRAQTQPVAPIAQLDLTEIHRVLLVLTTGLGDAILSTPVFPALRRALPSAEIRLLCRESWTDLFREDANLNGIISYPGKYRRIFGTLRALRRFAPDLAVILHGNDPDIIPLAYLAGSRFIVRIPWRHTRFPFLLSNTARPEDASTVPGAHYVDNRLRILDTLNIPVADRVPAVTLPVGVRAGISARIAVRLGDDARYWVYHARAADAYKSWPAEKARELIGRALEAFPNLAVILTGTARDRPTAVALTEGLSERRVLNLAGALSVGELAACLAGAAVVVAPDTGVLHFAAAVDAPTVALYAPTAAAIVGPRSRTSRHHIIQKPLTCYPCLSKRCPYEPSLCMDQIAVGQVLEGISALASGAAVRPS
jgi:ADP-heptose:LPS heptosyltransferase